MLDNEEHAIHEEDPQKLKQLVAECAVARYRKRQAKAATLASVYQHEIALLDSLSDMDLRAQCNVVIEKRRYAMVEAKDATASRSTGELVYFVDGSALPLLETSAAAVVHKKTSKKGCFQWETTSFLVRQNEAVCPDEAEFAAIAGALVMAMLKVKDQALKKRADAIQRVLIFSDSQRALREAQHWQHITPCRKDLENSAIVRRIIVSSQILSQLDVQVILHWVPDHARVTGNVRADSAARRMGKGIDRMASGCFFEDYYLRTLQGTTPSLNEDAVSITAQPEAEADTASIAKRRISMAFDPMQQCYVFCTER